MPGIRPLLGRAALPAAVVALLAAGCGAPPRASLAILPPVTAIAPGETLAFAADVRGSDEPVVWQVVEPEGGTIDERGRYTAPDVEGTFHVSAWVGGPESMRTAEVRVRRAAYVRAP